MSLNGKGTTTTWNGSGAEASNIFEGIVVFGAVPVL
jgi:hypothetical protein